MSIQPALKRVVEEQATLTLDEAAALMRRVLAGEAADVELAALLGAMAGRGETAEEIAGFAIAMRQAATMLPLNVEEQKSLVDTCGTGGDGSGTFNISTAAALVAAAAGAKVAKHGNRAITSRCGSCDVLDALGVATALPPADAADSIRRNNFAFLLAPAHHPAMKAVMPVRRALGVRTVLHVLGPLLNPAGARRQVMGVYHSRLVPVVAGAMTMLGVEHALVVHGDGGLDELSLSGPSSVAEVRNGVVSTYTLAPGDLGLQIASLAALTGGDAAANAQLLRSIFGGEPGPRRDIVLLNAAAVLFAAGKADTLRDSLKLAVTAIDSGAVLDLLQRLSVHSNATTHTGTAPISA